MSIRRPGLESPSASERACEIARAGGYTSVTKLRRQLTREGYSNLDELLDGAGFRKTLKKLSLDARRQSRAEPISRPARTEQTPP